VCLIIGKVRFLGNTVGRKAVKSIEWLPYHTYPVAQCRFCTSQIHYFVPYIREIEIQVIAKILNLVLPPQLKFPALVFHGTCILTRIVRSPENIRDREP